MNESIVKISILVSSIFFIFAFLATKTPFLEIIFNSLEPLGLILAITLYFKESPQRKKKIKYDALLTIDAAAGIHNSKARLIALEDLVDMGVKLEELDLKNSNLLEIEINGAEMNRSSFEGSVLKHSTLNLTQFQKCDFKNVEGSGTEAISANLVSQILKIQILITLILNNLILCFPLSKGEVLWVLILLEQI